MEPSTKEPHIFDPLPEESRRPVLPTERRKTVVFDAKWQPGESPKDYVVRLWNAFPCLRRKQVMTLGNWSAEWVKDQRPVWSSGEQAAAWFVLHVWNPENSYDLAWIGDLDRAERAVIAAWVADPTWA